MVQPDKACIYDCFCLNLGPSPMLEALFALVWTKAQVQCLRPTWMLFEPRLKSNAWSPHELKRIKSIIEVNQRPKREKFLNQSLFEVKNQSSPMLQAHMTLKRSHMILRKFKAQIQKLRIHLVMLKRKAQVLYLRPIWSFQKRKRKKKKA